MINPRTKLSAPENFELPKPVNVPKTAEQHNAQLTGSTKEFEYKYTNHKLLTPYGRQFIMNDLKRHIQQADEGMEITQAEFEELISFIRSRM
jgi:hypothetical protein